MQDIVIEYGKGVVNTEALDESLRAALGEQVIGITTGSGHVTLHLSDETPSADVIRARVLVAAHDPTQLSTRQQTILQRKQRLQVVRRDYKGSVDLDPADFTGSDPLLLALARKVAWLEGELNALRDGL
ncbi:MAG: hypothetical protein K8L99_15085 [Anaerolineae bacterium]|nr:hypothetical protein [Anaerolineae bacterium]